MFLKSTAIVTMACLLAGLIAYFGIREFKAPPHPAKHATAVAATAALQALNEGVPGTTTTWWQFKLLAAAVDDPNDSRKFKTSVEFQGVADKCEGSLRAHQSDLGVDTSGGLALAVKEVSYCVPGCAGAPPPAVVLELGKSVSTTAFQDEFDRAPADYVPQGQVSMVEWQCDASRTYRLSAAALVALACNSDNCDDAQTSNASVALQWEQGAHLDPVSPLFPLRSLNGSPIIASTVP